MLEGECGRTGLDSPGGAAGADIEVLQYPRLKPGA